MSPQSQTEPATVEAPLHYLLPGGGLPWREGTAEGLALPSFLE